ncbi:MAG: glycosyl hydrolase [Nitrosospira sp.]
MTILFVQKLTPGRNEGLSEMWRQIPKSSATFRFFAGPSRIFLNIVVAILFLSASFSSYSQTNQSQPIPREFFGLHIHRADRGAAWPNIPFGSWRLWDAYVTWAQLESAQNKWDFSRLDRYVGMAKQHNVEILLPLANTPQWAAARSNEPSGYEPGNASEPSDIEDWRSYVRTVGERYKGHIRSYEIWNEPNATLFYTGSIGKLIDLTCEAFKILKSIDPLNQIVSPAMSTGVTGHLDYLDHFLSAGGKDCIDIVAYHFYVPKSGPESMVPLIRQVRGVMKKNGVSQKPLWNTETGWRFPETDGTTPENKIVGGWKKIQLDDTSNFALRAFMLARAEGVDRFFWYSWDNPYGLGMIDIKSHKQKPIVEQWRNAFNRLLGVSQMQCSQNGRNWNCSFIRGGGAVDGVSWTAE